MRYCFMSETNKIPDHLPLKEGLRQLGGSLANGVTYPRPIPLKEGLRLHQVYQRSSDCYPRLYSTKRRIKTRECE